LIFLIGINTGLRVNDLVWLKVGNVKDKDAFSIRQKEKNRSQQQSLSHFGWCSRDFMGREDVKTSTTTRISTPSCRK